MSDKEKEKEVVTEDEKTVLAEITAELKQTKEELETAKIEHEKEKRALTRKILDNGKVEVEVVDVEELKKERDRLRTAYKGYETLSNREIWEIALALRDTELKLSGKDDFQSVNNSDPKHGERVAAEMKEILKEANGSDAMFNALYQDKIRDNPAYANLAKLKRK